ncbi:MAG: branched-chain amino acid transaminase [Nitrospinae bacterium]|nr:branched-chain amino acid transaminase [Nitrospinota bacterium]
MIKKVDKIWMDGELVDWDNAKVHILTHTLHYGLGVFEGIRCYKTNRGSTIFCLKEHIDRLFNSALVMSIKIPYTKEEIIDAIKKTIKVNKLNECYIRPIVYIGYGAMGINCKNIPIKTAIAVWPWGAYLGEEGLSKGIRVKISSFTGLHPNISLTKAKVCGNYVNSILAKTEAIEHGYDEAVILDSDGNVTQGSGENIFIVRDGILKTPPLTSILEGITRRTIIILAEDMGIKVREEAFSRGELYIADEAFFTGTAAEVTPIREVDSRPIGEGKPGPITKRFQEAFFAVIHDEGRNKKFREWLTYI